MYVVFKNVSRKKINQVEKENNQKVLLRFIKIKPQQAFLDEKS